MYLFLFIFSLRLLIPPTLVLKFAAPGTGGTPIWRSIWLSSQKRALQVQVTSSHEPPHRHHSTARDTYHAGLRLRTRVWVK